MTKFKLAIFDMDGVLVDSEVHWATVGPELWGGLGVKYNKKIEKDILGLNTSDSVKLINKNHGYRVPIKKAQEAYKSFRKVVYTDRSNLLPGVIKLLESLEKNNFKIGLASGASFESIGRVMDKHKLHDYFKVRLSTHDMNLPGKPDPTVYNKVIKKFRIRPEEVVIIEDAPPGVEAGKLSGAKVIGVLNSMTKMKELSHADLIVKSLADKRVYKFLGI